jgi:molybdate transport system substrate-binding protein
MRRSCASGNWHFCWLWLIPWFALSASCKGPPERAEPEGKLIVFAASSLRDAFSVLGEDFRQAHPEVELQFHFAGSHELRTQLEQGAIADLFASADQRHMQALTAARRVSAPVLFARNEPVLVVSQEKRSTLRSFSDLPLASRIIIGVPEVPIGRYTLQILERATPSLGADFSARVQARVVSRELNVRQVLAKVSLGEAEAGIVYRSDTKSSKANVAVILIPPDINVVAEYPIATLVDAPHPGLAKRWLSLLQSRAGRDRLTMAGFEPVSQATAAP